MAVGSGMGFGSEAKVGPLDRGPVRLEQAVLADLRFRLRHARFSATSGGWEAGFPVEGLRRLVDYWLDGFDWVSHERSMNQLDHIRAIVDGQVMHAGVARGRGPAPIPLVLVHGWPWTFWTFHKLIGPLTDPATYGADPADAFDVILPSLPGYVYSAPLRGPGIGPTQTAALLTTFVTEALGHRRFCVHGGDWGARVAAEMGRWHPEAAVALHLLGVPIAGMAVDRPWADLFAGLYRGNPTGVERAELVAWERRRAAHVAAHSVDPYTLGHALSDSPVGTLAWLAQRMHDWSDGGDALTGLSWDDVLVTATLYWATDTVSSASRFYLEAVREAVAGPPHPVSVPTAITLFRRDLPPGPIPQNFGAHFAVSQLRVHDRGGHFAPLESPEDLIQDLRDAFRPYRGMWADV